MGNQSNVHADAEYPKQSKMENHGANSGICIVALPELLAEFAALEVVHGDEILGGVVHDRFQSSAFWI